MGIFNQKEQPSSIFEFSADPNHDPAPDVPAFERKETPMTPDDETTFVEAVGIYMEQTDNKIPDEMIPDQEGQLDSGSTAEEAVDYTEAVKDSVFLGEIPFDVILEGINSQFQDYIKLEDKTNYVDIFYDQLAKSIEKAATDEDETHIQEVNEALDKMRDQFVSTMANHFNQRLMITITALDGESIDNDEIEYDIRMLYEYFILNARKNFMKVIQADIDSKMKTVIEDDSKYFEVIKQMLTHYSPLITVFGPMQFIKYTENEDVYDLFDSLRVTGNFLRKYSPKLYQNEEFEVELINYITMIKEVREEVVNGNES